MIKLIGVSKQYQAQDSHIFQELNLNLNARGFIAIMGSSGSGKSTFLKMIAGLDASFDGVIVHQHTELHRGISDEALSLLRRRSFAFVFQDFKLLNHYTVRQNLEIILYLSALKHTSYEAEIIRVMSEVNLDKSLLDRFPNSLSGGQKQRVAIARALLKNPEIIFADELTGSLDDENAETIMKLLRRVNAQGIGVIIATHSLDVAHHADQVLRVEAQGIYVVS